MAEVAGKTREKIVNKQGPKGIEWCDYTWNPIKGLCPVGCWYCYGRKIYQRFGMNPKVRLNLNELIMPFPKKPSRIFVCSTFELFHPIADKWRDEIFEIINLESRHTFIILTKMPERIDRPMPDNVWLGVSVSRRDDLRRIDKLHEAKSRVRFVSYEPLLDDDGAAPNGLLSGLDWVIVGKLTGHGHALDPSRDSVENIVKAAQLWDIPIFLKNNLREIWGPNLIQEFPK